MRRYRSLLAAVVLALLLGPVTAFAQTCPPEGDARGVKTQHQNVLKNRHEAPVASDMDAAATLDALLQSGDDLDRWDHGRGAVYKGGVETTNCHATNEIDQDTHIELALTEDAP